MFNNWFTLENSDFRLGMVILLKQKERGGLKKAPPSNRTDQKVPDFNFYTSR
jgi:hypothetical protein